MTKIWAKTMLDEKIALNQVFEFFEPINPDMFFEWICHICSEFDMPAPVVLSSHYRHFTEFNVAKFRPSDFVETVYCDLFVLENIP